jgi:AsmA protein
VRGDTPKYALATDLAGVQIDKLSKDYLGQEKAYMRGLSNLSLDVTTTGKSIAELKRALNGNVNLNAGNGALNDKKLAANVEKAAAFLKGREPKPSGEELVFDKLFGTFNITNGLSENKDFKLDTPLIFAKGVGKVNIAESSTDYTISIGLSDEPGKCGVPITIKGPFEKLSYGVDVQQALLCSQSEKIDEKKQELKQEFEEKKEKEVEKLKEKIGDKLKDKIKLF